MKKRLSDFFLKKKTSAGLRGRFPWQAKVLKILFAGKMNKTEVHDMFQRVEDGFRNRVHF